jgi:putative aldouronate transport system substrate-binding protein
MKKLLVLFWAAILAVSAFAGGQSDGGSGNGGGGRTGEKGALPISTKKPELSIFISGGLNDLIPSLDYKDNAITKKIVDDTGIQLNITSSTGGEATERLNVMLNTGNYPEVIANTTLDIEYYAQQGIIIAMDPYEPLSFPNINRVFTEMPFLKLKVTGSDGKIYALPMLNECLHCTYSNGRIWYYMPWIRDNNLKVPETLDEFTGYLRSIKNTDFNKNGRNDEIPLVFNRDDVQNFIARIAKAYMPFVYGNGYFGLALDNNRIVEQYRDGAFRETLRYITGLYREELILEDSFSMTGDQQMALVRNADPIVGVMGTSWAHDMAQWGTQRSIEYFYLPALKGPTGQQWGTNTDIYGSVSPTWYITDKCKDPDLAIALWDYMNSSFENSHSLGNGLKGEDWFDADPGTKGFDGNPAIWKMSQSSAHQKVNASWNSTFLYVGTQAVRVGQQADHIEEMIAWMSTRDSRYIPPVLENMGTYLEYMYWATSNNESKYALPVNVFIPPQLLNNTDATRVADINAVLDPFKTQAYVEFITGVRDINNDSHWNAYLTELDRLGSPEMVSIRQKYVK